MEDLTGYHNKVKNYILEQTNKTRDDISLQKFDDKKNELQEILKEYLQSKLPVSIKGNEELRIALLDRILSNINSCRRQLGQNFQIDNGDAVKNDPVYQMLQGVDTNFIFDIVSSCSDPDTGIDICSDEHQYILSAGSDLLESQIRSLQSQIETKSISPSIYQKLYRISLLNDELKMYCMKLMVEEMNMWEGQEITEHMIPIIENDELDIEDSQLKKEILIGYDLHS